MATATITDVLGAVEAALVASPSLGVSLVDGRQGITSATRAHYGVFVRRESTDNLDLYRDQDVARVEDEIAVDLTYRISPKDQRTSRDAALAIEGNIVNRLTIASTALASYHPRYVGTQTDTPSGEWQTVTITFALTRDQQVGAG